LQAGIEKLSGLEVLYMSNNKVRDWAEIDKLATLENLKVQYAAVMLRRDQRFADLATAVRPVDTW
jgi:hypothetical protein